MWEDMRISFLELNPDAGDAGKLTWRSLLLRDDSRHKNAVSELDVIAVFTDTFTSVRIAGEDPYDNRYHKPLGIQVRSSALSWSIEYLEDIVLYNNVVTNIGNRPIADMFIGYYSWGEYPVYTHDAGVDSYAGFKNTIEIPEEFCITEDTVKLVWLASPDGVPRLNDWGERSARAAIGLQFLGLNALKKTINFNWYGSAASSGNWGPRLESTNSDPFRDMFGSMGEPLGDKNKYYMLSHPEVDYDQMFAALDHTDEGFLPPSAYYSVRLARGGFSRSLYSVGPYDLQPGDSIQYTLAVFAGDNFHVNPTDYQDYFDPYNPQSFYDKLDFSDLALNSRRAKMIFDNPGYDTDGDGYSGEFCWKYIWHDTTDYNQADSFLIDSIKKYYSGDGVPDFRGMMPPPPPSLRLIPGNGKMTIRWNGQKSETTPDIFSGNIDFEGYRVYFAEDARLSSYVLLDSYDVMNFQVYEFYPNTMDWVRVSQASTLDSLQGVYGSDFDPMLYTNQDRSFNDWRSDRIFYFQPQGWNQSDLNDPLKIHKVYPNASPDDPTDLTGEGWMRYYEYEYSIDNLQPSRPYYFGVTAFDYGASAYDIGALETSPTTNAICEYPSTSADTVEHYGLKVQVYPNPYRIDGGYASDGYENRDRTRSAVWSRKIHFANLPNICTIRIYTLSGDLVQEIKHYHPEGGPKSQHEEWNVISRNTQAVVSGLYLWSVNSEMGNQVGKLVIIK